MSGRGGYHGNETLSGTFHKWEYADWFFKSIADDKHFKLHFGNGTLEVMQPGLYLLYSQITLKGNGTQGYHVMRNDKDPILACYSNNMMLHEEDKTSCFTMGMFKLDKRDIISGPVLRAPYSDQTGCRAVHLSVRECLSGAYLLFLWPNLTLTSSTESLWLKISSNSVSVNGCISINEAKKNAFKNSEPKNLEDKFMQNLSRKRRSRRPAVMKKIVHLRMNEEMNDTVLYSRVDNIGHCPGNSPKPCLRWDTPNEFPHMFDYVKDGYNKPVAIKVLSPGIYTVYAQLAISGPDTSTRFDPIVGFEIFLIRGPGKFTLTKGLTTQDQRGRRYHNTEHRQVDTVFVMGTFKFFCDDMMNFEQKREKRNGRWRNEVREEIRIMKEHISNIVNTTIPNLEAGIMKKVVHLGMSRDMTQDILHAPVNNIGDCSVFIVMFGQIDSSYIMYTVDMCVWSCKQIKGGNSVIAYSVRQ
uniref:THD domain-containing protein n=1 Tax=Magallana gigas TaxID=29159 RepID=K1QMH9_MAGGI